MNTKILGTILSVTIIATMISAVGNMYSNAYAKTANSTDASQGGNGNIPNSAIIGGCQLLLHNPLCNVLSSQVQTSHHHHNG
jgi:hypothetical protein